VAAGALAGLLPGGRSVDDAAHRAEIGKAWDAPVPEVPGRDTTGILAAAEAGELAALVCGAVEVADLPDPEAARRALDAAFVISLEQRESEVTARADVVLPVAAMTQRAGTFVDWEGRGRSFAAALPTPSALPDARVLAVLAAAMHADLGFTDSDGARTALRRLGTVDGARRTVDAPVPVNLPEPGPGEALLATWRQLLDLGRAQDGEPNLAATARPPVARLSAATAAEIGAADGEPVSVSTERGTVTLPLAVTAMPDRVVWLPRNSPGSTVATTLGSGTGAVVRIGVER
ncbi:molybdopterin dinucleotide binding domain-containing protein, partial [Tsukamurella sp. 1534]|uniref:molybdopterin dinucleotide binding domain-containing protein n=1 Tax=Tsukamurella sp. 1534 TaxID=1151061 RepID=UPI000593A587